MLSLNIKEPFPLQMRVHDKSERCYLFMFMISVSDHTFNGHGSVRSFVLTIPVCVVSVSVFVIRL